MKQIYKTNQNAVETKINFHTHKVAEGFAAYCAEVEITRGVAIEKIRRGAGPGLDNERPPGCIRRALSEKKNRANSHYFFKGNPVAL